MIKKIDFENYKAFKKGCIELRPITVLLGVNSSGKTSIIQLLLLIAQSLQTEERFEGAFKLNGGYVGLGESDNILHNKDLKNELSLSLEIPKISFSQERLKSILSEFLRVVKNISSFEQKVASKKGSRVDKESFSQLSFFLYDDGEKQESIFDEVDKDFIRKYNNALKRLTRRAKEDKDGSYLYFDRLKSLSYKEIKNAIKIVSSMDKDFHVNKVKYDFFFSKKEKEFYTKKISLYDDNNLILSFSNRRSNGYSAYDLESEVFDYGVLNECRTRFGQNCSLYGLLFESLKTSRLNFIPFQVSDDFLYSVLSMFFEEATKSVKESLSKNTIQSVSPLRAFPKRYYLIDQNYTENVINTKDGNSLADILSRKKNVQQKVNDWLEKFNLNVATEELKDIIHSIKVNQHGLSLDLTDVGFGISQVLPVIIQTLLAEENSITLIEQPEIHLHPKMQAEIADFFIDSLEEEKNKSIVVETHSEAFLKRLRRRISEGKINSEDVKIYFISRDEDDISSKIENIKISEKGGFDWPKEFTDIDIEDTLAYMKNQG